LGEYDLLTTIHNVRYYTQIYQICMK